MSHLPCHTVFNMCGWFACMCIYASRRPEEGIGSPRTEVTVVSCQVSGNRTLRTLSPASHLLHSCTELDLDIFPYQVRNLESGTHFFPTCSRYNHDSMTHGNTYWTWELWTLNLLELPFLTSEMKLGQNLKGLSYLKNIIAMSVLK